MKVLVTGAAGLLGGRLARLLGASGHEVIAGRHLSPPPAGCPEVPLDLLEEVSIERALEAAQPGAVLHCAALADADRCEAEPGLAQRLNTDAAGALARRCRALGVRLVAVSTDLVLAGDRPCARETDAAAPRLVYARTKLGGEQAVLGEAPEAAVVRVALIHGCGHGPRGTASEAVAWSLAAGARVRLFSDQYRTPVDPESVAGALLRLLAGAARGVFHVGGPERLSRYDLGVRVARALGLPDTLIEPIRQADQPVGAPRPADVSLDSSRARQELGWAPRPLDDAIRQSRRHPGD